MLKHMESVEISINNEEKEVKKFEGEFNKMDTMIHRFPAGLAGISKIYPYIIPRVVAIGPYHHGKEHLRKMEEVKKVAANYFCQRWNVKPEEAYNMVLSTVGEVRGMYIVDEIMKDLQETKNPDDAYFAAMMLRDACFLLLYMDDVYSRSIGMEEVPEGNHLSLRRFLFSNRDSVDNDIMLLENQLPWRVVQDLMCLVLQKSDNTLIITVVGKFIAGMGDNFRVTEPIESKCKAYEWDKERDPPPHLLALLRRYKIESNRSQEGKTNSGEPWCLPLSLPLLNPKVNSVSAISPMELEEIGIKLTADQTAAFSDMDLVDGCLLGELSLAPLSLSDARASCLVNMAAFEVCTVSRYMECPKNTAVCSYLALLAMFMVRKEDVHNLRSKGLLHGPHSNKEMLTFFKTVVMHLPDGGSRFAQIMKQIENYRRERCIRIKLYKWLYNNYKTIITVLSILTTLIGLYSGLYRAIISLNQKN